MASSSATVVRVKRKITDDPVDALVLSFKRHRGEAVSDDDDTANEVFRLTGTAPAVKDESDSGSPTETREQLKTILSTGRFPDRVIRAAVRRSQKVHVADIRLKSRQEKEEAVRQQRDSLLLAVRAIDMRETTQDESDTVERSGWANGERTYDASLLPDILLDIDESTSVPAPPRPSASAITCNDQPLFRVRPEEVISGGGGRSFSRADNDYVFDYYVPSKFCDDQDSETADAEFAAGIGGRERTSTPPPSGSDSDVSEFFSDLVAVYPYNSVYPYSLCEEAIDNGATEAAYHANFDDNTDDDDDEDSNAESNWRNEYPDEDDEFERRYDFYDQNYESPNNEEVGEFCAASGGRLKDGESMVDCMRGLKLGGGDGDEESFNAKSRKTYFEDDYDSDD